MFRLYWKIFIWFWLMLILTIVSVSWVSISLTQKSLITSKEKDLLQAFTLSAVTVLENGGDAALYKWSKQLKKSFNTEVFLVNAQTGELVGDPGYIKVKDEKTGSFFSDGLIQNPELIVTAYITTRDNQKFRLILSQGATSNIISRLYSKNLLIYLIVLILIMSLISYVLSRHLVRPLFKLRRNLQDFASGDLEARPDKKALSRGDEIGVLAQEYSNMADKIQSLIENSSQLLQDVSHELRSPLARLQIASSLIQQKLDKDLDKKEIEKMLFRIDKECGVLDDLIAEVLSYFRMQVNQDNAVKVKIDLRDLLKDLISSVAYENQIDKSKLNLIFQDKKSQDIKTQDIKLHAINKLQVSISSYCFVGQAKLLKRAFENILRNAMKYTEASRVDITLSVDEDNNKYIISFRDYGPGVPENMLNRLFDPFFRVHSDRGQKYGGYGLGLSIAQRAVTLHDGDIYAECHIVKGLVVTIELPIK